MLDNFELNVLIATSGRPELLGRTLASLESADKPVEYGRLVVVENGEPSGAKEVVTSVSSELNAEYVHVPLAGKSKALNAGIARLASGLVVMFDDDVIVGRGALVAYSEAAKGRPSYFFGGGCMPKYEEEPPVWLRDYLPISAHGLEVRLGGDGYFLGLNWAAWHKDLVSLGGFDSKFGPGSLLGVGGDETDIQRRMKKVGMKGWGVPGALVTHHVPVERCSLEWGLMRSYKNGLADGISVCGVTHGSIPSSIIKIPIFHILKYLSKNDGNMANYTRWSMNASYHHGYVKGKLHAAMSRG